MFNGDPHAADGVRRAIEPHRHEPRVHCYRMLAAHDADVDLVQETMPRAWRRHPRPRAPRSVPGCTDRDERLFDRAESWKRWSRRCPGSTGLDDLEAPSSRPRGAVAQATSADRGLGRPSRPACWCSRLRQLFEMKHHLHPASARHARHDAGLPRHDDHAAGSAPARARDKLLERGGRRPGAQAEPAAEQRSSRQPLRHRGRAAGRQWSSPRFGFDDVAEMPPMWNWYWARTTSAHSAAAPPDAQGGAADAAGFPNNEAACAGAFERLNRDDPHQEAGR